MTTLEWFARCGFVDHKDQAYVYNMEEKGFEFASQFQGLEKDDFHKFSQIDDEEHQRIAQAVLTLDTKRPDAWIGFQRPFQPRIKRECYLAYPECDRALATVFAWKCCDEQGRGLVSLTQLLAHFKRHAQLGDAIEHVDAELTKIERVEPEPEPEPEEPTDWIVSWLKDNELPHYVDNFLSQEVKTQEDLTICAWTDEDVKEGLGISKLGHRRKFLTLVDAMKSSQGDVSPLQ